MGRSLPRLTKLSSPKSVMASLDVRRGLASSLSLSRLGTKLPWTWRSPVAVVVRTKQLDRSETHQRRCSFPDRRGRMQRFGYRPRIGRHLIVGIRTPDRSSCAYRLHRQWWPSGFLSLLPEFVPAAKAVHANPPSREDCHLVPTVGGPNYSVLDLSSKGSPQCSTSVSSG
jgi:hypothetical protein